MLDDFDYSLWLEEKSTSEKEESANLPPMPPLEGDEEEVKEETANQNLNSKQTINQTSNIIRSNKGSK